MSRYDATLIVIEAKGKFNQVICSLSQRLNLVYIVVEFLPSVTPLGMCKALRRPFML